MENKSDVPPLPTNDDGFWKGAENDKLKPGPSVLCDKALHHFYRKSGTEAKCLKCALGFYISPETEIIEGHIHIKGKFVI